MSYYRYITGVYKSYKPELNRTLRSSSVPRHVPDIDTGLNVVRFRKLVNHVMVFSQVRQIHLCPSLSNLLLLFLHP